MSIGEKHFAILLLSSVSLGVVGVFFGWRSRKAESARISSVELCLSNLVHVVNIIEIRKSSGISFSPVRERPCLNTSFYGSTNFVSFREFYVTGRSFIDGHWFFTLSSGRTVGEGDVVGGSMLLRATEHVVKFQDGPRMVIVNSLPIPGVQGKNSPSEAEPFQRVLTSPPETL